MRIRIYSYEFLPSQLMMFLSLVFFILFLALGNWQLQRAEIKRDIEQRYKAQLDQPYQYVVLDEDLDESLNYRKIALSGSYRLDRVLLVDNKIHQGIAGYHILMPFEINGGRQTVLVNRGWVSGDYDRSRLPDIRAPKVGDKVDGVLTIPDASGFRMGQVEITSQWPQLIPYIDMEKIQQGLDFKVLPYVIWQAPEMDDYYVRDWKPVWSPPEKSEAYAVQWFSFAAIVLILFIALNIKPVKSEEST